MTELYIVVEGPTEENFINNVIGPALNARDVYPYACIIGKPGFKGGNVKYPRLKSDVLMLLKQRREVYCTTFIDFYGRGKGFPSDISHENVPSVEKVRRIDDAIKTDIVAEGGDALRATIRFLPYIQLHEFEGLLFSDPIAFAKGIYEPKLGARLQEIRQQFASPEDINDSPQTAPSKRILQLHPGYNKKLMGTLASIEVGLNAMRRECHRFNDWLGKLEALNEKHF